MAGLQARVLKYSLGSYVCAVAFVQNVTLELR
ncbi:hypothetical protein BH09VER1_BH09VER1_47570 [soil metagenome]